jgi:DNA-binding LytR/AlgR family response regulator
MTTPDSLLESSVASVLRGRRILILEDELLLALETKTFIWNAGGIVIGPYARVAGALEAIQVQPIDGAILDVNVAGILSFGVADALQDRKVPFVFCTAYGQDVVPPRFRRVPIVEKPLMPEMLIAALARAFAASAAKADR